MSQNYRSPPKLLHRNSSRSDIQDELCFTCASRLHLSKGERVLLLFYASCSTGFRPSLERIAQQTGLSRNHIPKVRRKLAEHGVLKISDNEIIIDWQRIRLFASLDPAMVGRHVTIAPVSSGPEAAPFKPDRYFFYAAPVEKVCEWFGQIHFSKYSKWKRWFRASKKSSRAY